MSSKTVLVAVPGQEAREITLEETETVQDALNKFGFEGYGTFSLDGDIVNLEAVPGNNSILTLTPSKVVQA